MTTTATKAKPTDVLAQLDELDEAHRVAAEQEEAVAAEHAEKLARARELLGQRQREIHNDPAAVDHTGQPAKPGNIIAKLDEKLTELDASGSVDELQAKVEHLRKIEEHAKRETARFAGEHLDEIVESLRPDAERAIEGVRRVLDALRTAAGEYAATCHRVEHLRASVATLADSSYTKTRVPALSRANELLRALDGWQVPESLEVPTIR